MCSAPKPPKVQPIPDRRASVLPNGGDPAIRAADRSKRRLTSAAAIFTQQTGLGIGMPNTTMPSTLGA